MRIRNTAGKGPPGGRGLGEAQVRGARCRSAEWMAPATQTEKAPSVSGSLPGPAGTCSWAGTTEAGPRMSPKPHTGTDLRSWRPPLWRRVSRGQGSLPRPLAPKGHTPLPRLYSPCLNSAALSGGEGVQVPPLALPRVCPPLGFSPTQHARQPLVSGILAETLFFRRQTGGINGGEGRQEWGNGGVSGTTRGWYLASSRWGLM